MLHFEGVLTHIDAYFSYVWKRVTAVPTDETAPQNWFSMSPDAVLSELNTSLEKGLPREEAVARKHRREHTLMRASPVKSAFKRTLTTLFNPLTWLWLLTPLVLLATGRKTESAMLSVILVFQVSVVFIRECRAGRALEDLDRMARSSVKVLRDELVSSVRSDELVPGDIIFLEAGDAVPADVRLLQATQLEVKESLLTGEPMSVVKRVKNSEEAVGDEESEGDKVGVSLAGKSTMVFMGSIITRGNAVGCITAVEDATEYAKIISPGPGAGSREMSFYHRMKRSGRIWTWSWVVIAALAAVLVNKQDFSQILSYPVVVSSMEFAATCATSALPWGILSLLSIITALGLKRMVVRQAVVRSVSSVEKLARITAICSSKLGILTTGAMKVTGLWTDGVHFLVAESSDQQMLLKSDHDGSTVRLSDKDVLVKLLKSIILCTSARLEESTSELGTSSTREKSSTGENSPAETWTVLGDTTEGALLTFGASLGFSKKELQRGFSKTGDFPFDPVRRRMTVVYRNPAGKIIAFSKGAPESLIESCQKQFRSGAVVPFGQGDKELALQFVAAKGQESLRSLAVAYRELESFSPEDDIADIERDLVFLGLVTLHDPPREHLDEAVRSCKSAGIKLVMVSGDHKTTATRFGRDVGILENGKLVLSGEDIDRLSEDELNEKIGDTGVCARLTPAHKLRVIHALQATGELVAITGEDLTDIPLFAEADAGISLGHRGNEAVRETSDLVLTDDSFSTMIGALLQARIIMNNITESIRHVLETHIGELVTFLAVAALIINGKEFPLPFTFLQLMFINTLVLTLPTMAVGIDPGGCLPESNCRQSATAAILVPGIRILPLIVRGVLLALITLGAFIIGYTRTGWLGGGESVALARTMAFAAITISQLLFCLRGNVFRKRPLRSSLFRNKFLLPAVLLALCGLLFVLYLPAVNSIFQVVQLGWKPLFVIILLSAVYLIPVERLVAPPGKD